MDEIVEVTRRDYKDLISQNQLTERSSVRLEASLLYTGARNVDSHIQLYDSVKPMAKFLTTSAVTYHLENIINGAKTHLVLISPFLRFNDRIKQLISDKMRTGIDFRIVYGKTELKKAESAWLDSLNVRVYFCKNLHAKCYLNDSQCIVTSMNLYEFSQVNNHEMGILITRVDDASVYKDTFEEAKRLLRISDETTANSKQNDDGKDDGKLSTSKLAKQNNFKTAQMLDRLTEKGLLKE